MYVPYFFPKLLSQHFPATSKWIKLITKSRDYFPLPSLLEFSATLQAILNIPCLKCILLLVFLQWPPGMFLTPSIITSLFLSLALHSILWSSGKSTSVTGFTGIEPQSWFLHNSFIILEISYSPWFSALIAVKWGGGCSSHHWVFPVLYSLKNPFHISQSPHDSYLHFNHKSHILIWFMYWAPTWISITRERGVCKCKNFGQVSSVTVSLYELIETIPKGKVR